jgi:exopolyphosphatase / guanosine-5'-triphosphate,3'-diphosphate pyrophosphatase
VIVAVIDVGSNSVRLLVADADERGVRQRRRERVYLRLGDDAYRLGRIGEAKLEKTRTVIASFVRLAREEGAMRLETIVTAPGRQAGNADELMRVLASETSAPVVLLSAEDEGRLAWEGAIARAPDPPEVVAAVDLGGGSCEIAVGTPTLGPAWVRSFEAGALRVTRAFLEEIPAKGSDLGRARSEIARLLDTDSRPPLPDLTLAVGGTAQAVAKILGRRFGTVQLDALADRLATFAPREVAARFDVTKERAETLLGGTLVLAQVARLVGTELELGRGGLREGAALALARADAAAA